MSNSTDDNDLKVQDTVPADQLRNTDHAGQRFAELGQKLLQRINRTNVITLEQFMPYIELFKRDNQRLDEGDFQYRHRMMQLFDNYRRELNINLYEPTIVINSKEDPTVVVWLGKCLSYVAPDNLSEANRRDNINSSVIKSPTTTREQIMLKASLTDLHDANSTPEQAKLFQEGKLMSAIVNGMFFKTNLSPEVKDRLESELSGLERSDTKPNSSSFINEGDFFLDDGE